jgi:hypothetical protein
MSTTPPSGRTDPVTARIEADNRRRDEQRAYEEERERLVLAPGRLLRERWDATWTAFLAALCQTDEAGIDNAGVHLAEIGRLIVQYDELNQTSFDVPTANKPWFLKEFRVPRKADFLAALAVADGFYWPHAPVAAGLLSNAINEWKPADLAGQLRTVMANDTMREAIGWLPFLRDRIWIPPSQEGPGGVRFSTQVFPECTADVRDIERAEKIVFGYGYLSELQDSELAAALEPIREPDDPYGWMQNHLDCARRAWRVSYQELKPGQKPNWQAVVDELWDDWRRRLPGHPPPPRPTGCATCADAQAAADILERELNVLMCELAVPSAPQPPAEAAPSPVQESKMVDSSDHPQPSADTASSLGETERSEEETPAAEQGATDDEPIDRTPAPFDDPTVNDAELVQSAPLVALRILNHAPENPQARRTPSPRR